MTARGSERDDTLIRICDLAGRPRGTGFLADADGTMITSHEAVDGLARLVLHAPGGQVCLAEAGAVTSLPEQGLALVATEGLSLPPLPVAAGGPAHPEQRTRLRLRHRAEGSVIGTTAATYTATDRFHLLDEVYELALEGGDLSQATPQVSGSPLIDAATGAVLGVVVTALHTGHRASGFAVPLRAGNAPEPLARLLARNAATVPAYGPHLNLAGALRLTGASVGPVTGPGQWPEPVPRPELADGARTFLADTDPYAPVVLGLVGRPGSGRSTELARLAAERSAGPRPAPTLWLRGADLRPGDGSVKDAVERSLRSAARIVRAADGGAVAEPCHAPPAPDAQPQGLDALAALARGAGRPLAVLLDAPEEMPPVLAHALADWLSATDAWLRGSGARLVVACRPEFWEQVGTALESAARALPVGGLTEEQAAAARERHGLPPGAAPPADAAHPLALRLLGEVRAALPGDVRPALPPSRTEVFSAHLDLVCLRIATRLAASSEPVVEGAGVRRLAARVAGRVHEAARRCLGPGQGELDREAFEELFPWRSGWASAVLSEGLLVPAGAGYRFAHEEAADWLQSLHLDLGAALHALVHRWFASPGILPEAPVRLPARPAASRVGRLPAVPPAPPVAPTGFPRSLPVPRHRAGPVLQALLAAPPAVRAAHLRDLLQALDHRTPHRTRVAVRPAEDVLPDRPSCGCGKAPHGRQPDGRTGSPPPTGHAAAGPDTGPSSRGFDPPGPSRSSGSSGPLGPAHAARATPAGQAAAIPAGTPDRAERRADALWWAAHLVHEALVHDPDLDILRELAGRVVVRAVERGGLPARPAVGAAGETAAFHRFGPSFWRALRLPAAEHLELLRLLLPADGPPAAGAAGEDRFLAAAAGLLRDHPAEALPAVCGWLADDRPLQTDAGAPGAASLTVASAAQALLFTHRRLAVDDLTEALVAAGRPEADEVLAALAEEEPSAMCRAVDRWAHDARTDRQVAAAVYGPLVAPHVRSAADRQLLRYAALAILTRPGGGGLHGAALALLVRDPATRDRYLAGALRHFAAGDPQMPAAALAPALATHPEPVLAAYRARLTDGPGGPCGPPGGGPGVRQADREHVPAQRRAEPFPDGHRDRAAAGILAELADADAPALARHAAGIVEDHLRRRPAAAPEVARFLDARLEQGPGVRPVLLPLVTTLLREHPAHVRRVLAPVFAAPGTRLSRPLRQELLDLALEAERDCAVLEALLAEAAGGSGLRHPLLTRDLVHRLGLLMGRTPEGAALFDCRLVELAAAEPDFARLLRIWLSDGASWDALVGPSARRRLETVA